MFICELLFVTGAFIVLIVLDINEMKRATRYAPLSSPIHNEEQKIRSINLLDTRQEKSFELYHIIYLQVYSSTAILYHKTQHADLDPISLIVVNYQCNLYYDLI